jgi:phage virion morphogenesis protein
MALALKVSVTGLKKLNAKLDHVAKQVTDMEPALEEIGKYLVRSFRNRIFQQKKDPTGRRWPDLSETTQEIRVRRGYASNNILVQSGELARSIDVESANRNRVEVVATAPHAPFMQKGVRRTGGRSAIPGKRIPPRPFMGISKENERHILDVLNAHIKKAVE